MNRLLIAIPVSESTAKQAENLIDWIYQLSGRETQGHALIVFAKEVDAESREMIKISCELAFESFVTIESPTGDLLLEASKFIPQNYQWPFLWMDSGCVPLKKNWLKSIAEGYEDQPRPYMGAHLMAGDKIVLSRAAVYPNAPDFTSDIFRKSSKSRLFQFGAMPCELRADAVLFLNDREQSLIPKLRESINEVAQRMEKARAARKKVNV